MPTFCTWKIYTAPTRRWEKGWKGNGGGGEQGQILRWKPSECGQTACREAVGGMWTSPTDQHWLTHRDKFTRDLLVTWVHGHFPMVTQGWYEWQEASTAGPRKGRGSHHCRDKLMDQQSYPRPFATCARLNQSHQQKIALFSTATNSKLSMDKSIT